MLSRCAEIRGQYTASASAEYATLSWQQHPSGNEYGLLRTSTLQGNKGNSSKENLGFPDSSTGKESPCNAGDPSSIPGSGRSTGEGIGYPLQHSGLENSVDCIVRGDRKESDTTE